MASPREGVRVGNVMRELVPNTFRHSPHNTAQLGEGNYKL